MRNHRSPKGPKITAAQEAHLGQAEQCNMRARILEIGVKGFLTDEGSPYSQAESTKAARDVLNEAITLREQARTHHRNAFPEDFSERRRVTTPPSRSRRTSKTAASRAGSKASRSR